MTSIKLLWVCLLCLIQDISCASEGCATTNVNIRSRATTRSTILGRLKTGSCLPYKGTVSRGRWAKVIYNGRDAWIYKRYLKIKETASSDDKYNCFGDVMKLRPTGAGLRTAKRLGVIGVAASNLMVDKDATELNKRKSCYVRAGKNNCIHPAVIAAIASRETRGGKLLYKTKGWGDHGRAWGIMQCDVHTSGLVRTCKKYDWDSCEHINQMTRTILVSNIRRVKKKHPSWKSEQLLQGGVAAYNFGVSNVGTWGGLDRGSTGNDYSNDVIARAQHLIKSYGW